MKNVMVKAWEIAREGQKEFGGKVSEYIAEALRIAWARIKGEALNYKSDLHLLRYTLNKFVALAKEAQKYKPNTAVIDVEVIMEKVTPSNIKNVQQGFNQKVTQAEMYVDQLRYNHLSKAN